MLHFNLINLDFYKFDFLKLFLTKLRILVKRDMFEI